MSILLHENSVNRKINHLRGKRKHFIEDVSCTKFLNDIFDTKRKIANNKNGFWANNNTIKSLCNADGWFLLFCSFPLHEMEEESCFDVHFKNKDELLCDEDMLNENVKLLNCFFNFDPNKFLELYHYDKSCLWGMINNIVNIECFMNNRFHRSKKIGSVVANIYPLKYSVPNISLVCDGINFPVEVCKYDEVKVEEVDIDGFGVATYILCGDEVVDCAKVNDFRLHDSGLSLRKKFLHRSDRDVKASLKCMNFDEMLEAGRLMGANSKDGLLVRECGQNLINCKWFRWCKDSVYLAPVMQSGLPGSLYFRYDKVAYYNMENEKVGGDIDREIAPDVILDDVDVINFEKIMEI